MLGKRALFLCLVATFVVSAPAFAGKRTLVGQWSEKIGAFEQRITIIQESGKYFRISKFQDGSSVRHELREIKARGDEKRRFKNVSSRHGAYYAIDKRGNLDLYDREGFIRTVKKK